jgi:two-component system, OmpR family, phosphate regulon response regulator PhoB
VCVVSRTFRGQDWGRSIALPDPDRPDAPAEGADPPQLDQQQLRYAEDLARLMEGRHALQHRLAGSGEPVRLLIADDDPHVRLLITATLAHRPLEILQAETGTQALELVQQHHPRVALLDVRMPELDGFTLCTLIKADPETAATRVVIITSATTIADQEHGRIAGADGYLTKPFSPVKLLELLDRLLAT